MTPAPLVSIVLPTLNSRRFLAHAIAQCLAQTQADLELIVVDGGSTDGTLEVVAGFDDARVRLRHQAGNSGRLPGALNEGFAAARGAFWTWTQADDYYWPDAIAVMLAHLQRHPEIGLTYCGYWVVDEHDQIVRAATLGPPEEVWWTNPVGHCFLYRREVGEAIGPYAVDYYMAEDIHYWLRVYRRFRLAYLPEPRYAHRLHPASLTMAQYGRYLALRLAARARRQVLGLSWGQYLRQVAAAYVEEAFAAQGDGAYARMRASLLRGVMRDPRWLANRGVRSLLAQSALGARGANWWRRRSAARPLSSSKP
jgi:glycosyltransferase involved in cell wall biosynthesis